MARSFDSTDAKRIIERHRKLLAELVRAEESFDGLRTAITKTSDELVAQEVLNVLKDIPVDELNRDKRGIRIKLLREHGYQSIADITGASVYSLASINGISDDAAYYIKHIADQIVSTTRQGVKIRLSEDNKTAAATQVVLAISKFRNSEQYIIEARKLNKVYSSEIEYAKRTGKTVRFLEDPE